MQSATLAATPAVEPVGDFNTAIDGAHLARMTMGNRSLEREVLQLFDRQAAILVERMRTAEWTAIAPLAHTLKGSALNIGARGVVRACEALEASSASEYKRAVDRLGSAVAEARERIAEMLWLGD